MGTGSSDNRRGPAYGSYNRFVKRTIDILLSSLGLIVLSPVMLVSAILIKLTSEGPVIFKQKRLGRGAKEFTIYKFRTMRVNSEHTGSGVYSDDRDPRMTGVGRVLRKMSLDELRQLGIAGRISAAFAHRDDYLTADLGEDLCSCAVLLPLFSLDSAPFGMS